jgi:hypothetical protein
MFFGFRVRSALMASTVWVCTPAVETGMGGTVRFFNEIAWLAVVPLPAGQPVDAATAAGEEVPLASTAQAADSFAFRVATNRTCEAAAAVVREPSSSIICRGWTPVGSATSRIALPGTLGSVPSATAVPASGVPVS